MSNYEDIAINPKTDKIEKAVWVDDSYGTHRYGVRFADGGMYPEQDVKRVSSLELFAALKAEYERGQRDAFLTPGEDLVERVAKAFFAATVVEEEAEHRTDAPDTTWEDLDDRSRRFTYRTARAILAEIGKKTDV